MRRRRKDFGRAKLLAILFLAVVFAVPYVLNANAANELGSFEAGETGIKLCAVINNGNEDYLRFYVSSNQGFSSDVLVQHNTCRRIPTVAATYTIRQYVPQEYTLTSVTGGTISADNASFVATATGQYTIIHTDTYTKKNFLKAYGYSSTNTVASAVEVRFNANGGTGTMNPQRYGLNASQPLDANTFEYTGYNFTGWNTKADGTGTPYTDEQSVSFATGGILELFAQWELAPDRSLYNEITSRTNNGLDTNIDFSKKAVSTDTDPNGAGLNIVASTENDEYPVYYFRGDVTDNNVIWANMCWKIVRTTDTGGVKMIYNGLPTTVGTAQQCNATGNDVQISVGGATGFTFSKNSNYTSPADVGYMFGERIITKHYTAYNTNLYFSRSISRSGDTYTLNNYTKGTWASNHYTILRGYRYVCLDYKATSPSCDNNNIGYIVWGSYNDFYYLPIGGYDGIEDAKNAMFANTTNSNAKDKVETWFEQQNLVAHEDDLEDAIFCNDRSLYSGTLKTEDESVAWNNDISYFGAYGRNSATHIPSLDCVNKDDAFTKDDETNGNGKLAHKIGLMTADELTMAGNGASGYDTSSYLYADLPTWSLSPYNFGSDNARGFFWNLDSSLSYNKLSGMYGLRPVVSLKSGMEFAEGGDGTKTNPYVVE